MNTKLPLRYLFQQWSPFATRVTNVLQKWSLIASSVTFIYNTIIVLLLYIYMFLEIKSNMTKYKYYMHRA